MHSHPKVCTQGLILNEDPSKTPQFIFFTCLTLTRDQLCPLIVKFFLTRNSKTLHTYTHPTHTHQFSQIWVCFFKFLRWQPIKRHTIKKVNISMGCDSSIYSVPTVEKGGILIFWGLIWLLNIHKHTTTGSRFNSPMMVPNPKKNADADAAKVITAVKESLIW